MIIPGEIYTIIGNIDPTDPRSEVALQANDDFSITVEGKNHPEHATHFIAMGTTSQLSFQSEQFGAFMHPLNQFGVELAVVEPSNYTFMLEATTDPEVYMICSEGGVLSLESTDPGSPAYFKPVGAVAESKQKWKFVRQSN